MIVFDNAPYHSVQADKAPNSSNRKEDLINWLERKGVEVNPQFKKVELVELVKRHKPQQPKYIVDNLLQSYGHKVIRLPPYHCHFNPIELIWAQIKGYVARNNQAFTVTEIKRLFNEAVQNTKAEQWGNVVRHVEKVLGVAWENEGIIEEAVEDMIISVRNSSSSEEESSDTDEDPFLGCRTLQFEEF